MCVYNTYHVVPHGLCNYRVAHVYTVQRLVSMWETSAAEKSKLTQKPSYAPFINASQLDSEEKP